MKTRPVVVDLFRTNLGMDRGRTDRHDELYGVMHIFKNVYCRFVFLSHKCRGEPFLFFRTLTLIGAFNDYVPCAVFFIF